MRFKLRSERDALSSRTKLLTAQMTMDRPSLSLAECVEREVLLPRLRDQDDRLYL